MSEPFNQGFISGDLMPWREYSEARPIFNNLSTIQSFSLLLDIPPSPEIARADVAGSIAAGFYGHVREAVKKAKFFADEELSLSADAGTARVTYNDDRFDFAVLAQDGNIMLQRAGSNMEDFHAFYGRLCEHLPEMMKGCLSTISEVPKRSCEITRGRYIFEFLIYDIRSTESNRPIRNSEVIGKVITVVPGDDGALSPLSEPNTLTRIGRIDANVSRWVKAAHAGGMRLEVYRLEAPANKEGTALWAKFSYGGETYTVPNLGDKERVSFNGNHFLEEYENAYIGFLRNKALDRFLRSLMTGCSFKSSASTLP